MCACAGCAAAGTLGAYALAAGAAVTPLRELGAADGGGAANSGMGAFGCAGSGRGMKGAGAPGVVDEDMVCVKRTSGNARTGSVDSQEASSQKNERRARDARIGAARRCSGSMHRSDQKAITSRAPPAIALLSEFCRFPQKFVCVTREATFIRKQSLFRTAE